MTQRSNAGEARIRISSVLSQALYHFGMVHVAVGMDS